MGGRQPHRHSGRQRAAWLLALYAGERWSPLWRGRVAGLAHCLSGHGQRAVAGAVALLALWPATVRLLWAAGSTAGLSAGVAERYGGESAAGEAAFVLYAVMTVAGLVPLVLRRGGRLPLRVPLLCAGVGPATLGTWGGWLPAVASVAPGRGEIGVTAPMGVTYAVQMITGLLVLAAGARFFTGRAARLRARAS
ncbi:hypothetical protein AB0K09_23215 [Streptomyces sp. NPDC049577]|uniref:hypothetical protein n=1 Tax=Streptomyces sp. NPDC049577 TaxID=3155153 RepID=UPI00343967C4